MTELKRVIRVEKQYPDKEIYRRSYALVGNLGAVEFWYIDPSEMPEGIRIVCAGVEGHWRPTADKKESRNVCDLLGGPCHHDGTSL